MCYTPIAPMGLFVVMVRSCYAHCAPLERGNWTYRLSTYITLLWSEENFTYFPYACRRVGTLAGSPDSNMIAWIQESNTKKRRSVRLGLFMVDLRMNETLQTGAVGNRTYRGTEVSIYL